MSLATKYRTVWLAVAAVLAAMVLSSTTAPQRARADSVGQEGSGGKAIAHYAGGRVIRGGKIARKAPDARMYRVGLNAAEPTLGVTEKGNVFYTAFQGNTQIDIVRSDNDGKSWDVVSPKLPSGQNAHVLSVDPYVYVDDSEGVSRIFTIDLTLACSYLSFSDDEGGTWTTNPLACGQPVNDHQTLFAGPPVSSPTIDYPNIVYYCWNDIVTTSCTKSLDGGLTWIRTGAPPYPGADPSQPEFDYYGVPTVCDGLTGHGAVGPDGTVYVPRGWCGQPYISVSKDEGQSWTQVKVADNGIPDHEAAVAVDSLGNVYYLWFDIQMRLPYLAISRDQGMTWSKPIAVGPPGLKEANLPTIDATAPGKIALAYLGSENSPGGPFARCYEDEEACPYDKTTWNGYITMSANALSKKPVFYTSTVNNKKDPLVRDTCGPGRCRAQFDFIDIEIAPDGTPWASFVDGCISVCVTQGPRNIGADGLAGRLVGGPPLR